MSNSNAWAHVLNLASFLPERQSLHCFDCCDKENVHFDSRKAYVAGNGLRSRVEATNFAEILCFQNMRKVQFDTPVLGQLLSDSGRVKTNVSPSLL